MLPERLNPVVLTDQATRMLSRRWLLTLCVLYVAAGLLGRDAWNNDDVTGFAAMLYGIKQGWQFWFTPHIGGLPFVSDGPLTNVSGALLMTLTSPLLDPHVAARISTAAWLTICLMSVWYGTYLLGRRPEAQPVTLPFGGTPSARNYGRALADVGLLLLLACPGIVLRTHETSGAPLALASACLLYFGLARVLDKWWQGAAAMAAALVVAALSKGFVTALMPLAAMLFALIAPAYREQRSAIAIALASGCGLVALAVYGLQRLDPQWTQLWLTNQWMQFGFDGRSFVLGWLRDVLWLAWPAAVFGLVGLWRWRHNLHAPLLQAPLVLIAAAIVHTGASRGFDDADRLLVAVPVVMLGALALPTLRRALANLLDAISLTGYTIAIALLWLGWIAMQFKWPATIANNIARQAPDFVHRIDPITMVLALACTIGWITLCVWRIANKPKPIWRGPLLAGAGAVLSWTMLMSLWLPELNYVRSGKAPMVQIATAVPTNTRCISLVNMDYAQAANLWLATGKPLRSDMQCTVAVQHITTRPATLARLDERDRIALSTPVTPPGMRVVLIASRPSEKRERYVLYQRD